jgi:hypothetical protein
MTLYYVLIKLSQASVLIPLAVGLGYYKYLNQYFRIFLLYFVVAFGVELLAVWATANLGYNVFLLYGLIPFEFAVFIYVFFSAFTDNDKLKKMILAGSVLFLLAVALDLNIHGIFMHPSISRTFESVFLIILALQYFYNFFKHNVTAVYKQPLFWFSAGVLVYFAVDFFTFMMINVFIEKNESVAYLSKLLHALVNIISYLFYTIAFRCFRKQQQIPG